MERAAKVIRADIIDALREGTENHRLRGDALLALDNQLYLAEVVIAKLERLAAGGGHQG